MSKELTTKQKDAIREGIKSEGFPQFIVDAIRLKEYQSQGGDQVITLYLDFSANVAIDDDFGITCIWCQMLRNSILALQFVFDRNKDVLTTSCSSAFISGKIGAWIKRSLNILVGDSVHLLLGREYLWWCI